MIALCFLSRLSNFGEEQGICFRNYPCLFEYARDILNRCCGVCLINICFIYHEFNITVMRQCVWYVFLFVRTNVPATFSVVIFISGCAHLGEMKCFGIKPSYIASYEWRCQGSLHQDFKELRAPLFCII